MKQLVLSVFCTLIFLQTNAQSVETDPKNAPHQKPAFEGQTRVAAVKTKAKYNAKILTDKLIRPWGLDFLPNGKMIVSELEGRIKIVSKDGKVSEPLKNVPPVRAISISGLMDIKVSPNFAKDRYIFWNYVERVQDSLGVSCVAKGKLSADESAFEDVQVILRTKSVTKDGAHVGGRMIFGKDGTLYITTGDRVTERDRINAQNLNSHIGKTLRINQDGTPAKGNPFIGKAEALPEIWSYGHRNAQGLAINPVTGEVWVSEHGADGGDEINIIKPAANYGWPIVAYGTENKGKPINGKEITQQEGTEQPTYYYDPSIGICGATFYTGNLMPEWKNNLFVSVLKGMHIARLVINNKTHRVTGEERLLSDEKQRFRHVVQGPDQALYAITDQGRLYRIGK